MATTPEPQTTTPYVWIALVAVLGLAVVSIVAINSNDGPITVATNGQQDVLSVTGTHVLEVAPDQAVLIIGVLTNDTTAQAASSANSATLNAVIAALKNQGIADANIETQSITLSKNQQWDYKNQVYIDQGYQQTSTLKVTLTDLTKVGVALDAAVGAGANSVQDIRFELKPATEEQYKQQALTEATMTATNKARILASAANADLGKVVSISENSYNYAPYYYNSKDVLARADGGSAPTPISPQKVSISVSVNVAYELQ